MTCVHQSDKPHYDVAADGFILGVCNGPMDKGQCEAVNGNGLRCVYGKDHSVPHHLGDDGSVTGLVFRDQPCPDEYADD